MEKTLEPLRDQLEDTEQQIIDMVRARFLINPILKTNLCLQLETRVTEL